MLVCHCLIQVVLGLGWCHLVRLPAGMVLFGLVVFWPAPCAACFVGSASSSPPFDRCVRVALVSGWVVAAFVLFARTLLLLVRRDGFLWCGGAWLGLSSCVLPGRRLRLVRVGGARGGVLAGAIRGLCCSVLSSPPYGRRVSVDVVSGWVAVVAVLIA